MHMGAKLYNAIGALLAVGAGFAAQKLIETVWKIVMNDDPPDNPEDPEVSLGQAVSWAVASGMVIAVAKLLTSRQWTRYYTGATGKNPELEEDAYEASKS